MDEWNKKVKKDMDQEQREKDKRKEQAVRIQAE
jgi:hypothetical protein